MNNSKIGMIAGYGAFPLELAETLVQQGFELHVVAAREETFRSIEELATTVTWLHVGQIGAMIKAFQKAGVEQVVMAGKVRKLHMFRNFRPDFVAVKAMLKLPDRKDDTIMLAITQLLADGGIQVISQVEHAGAMIAGEGHLYGPKPGKKLIEDMQFGFAQAKGVAALDIGQTIVVQQGAVLAVEAIEGTDEAIRRGGTLGNGKAVVVKVAKPEQDLRFDVPAMGPDTLEVMHGCGCTAIAVEAGYTLLIERQRLDELADRYGISIYGLPPEGSGH